MKKTFFSINKTIIATLLCFLMVSNVAFAVPLTDVTSSHWANDVVQNVVDKEIMAFYSDNSFKPNQEATKIEAIITLYNVALTEKLLTPEQGQQLGEKYAKKLEGLNIPKSIEPYGEVVYPALGYALENKIVVEDEVKYFVSKGIPTTVSKVEASVYYGKALNLYKKENLDKVITLSFKDAQDITLVSWKYVNLLIDYNVVSGKGDTNGNFNPKTILNRSVLAVFADGYDKAILSSPVTDIEPTIPDSAEDKGSSASDDSSTETSDRTVSGVITDVLSDLNFIEVKESNGKTETFSTKEAAIYANNVLVTADELKDNVNVVLTISDSKVTKINMSLSFDKAEGTFNSLSDYIGTTDRFRSIRVLKKSGGIEFKRVYEDTPVIIDGVKSTVDKIEANYAVTLYYDDYNAISIQAYSDHYEMMGMLKSDINIVSPTELQLTLEDGTTFTQKINTTVIFDSENKNLNRNDIVSVLLEYGQVKKITYKGQVRDVVGNINSILISQKPEIELLKANGEKEKFLMSSGYSVIGEDGKMLLDIYSLRLNQLATIHVGIGGVDKISLGTAVVKDGIDATVNSVISSSNLLIVTLSDGSSMTVALKAGSTISLGDYQAGDHIILDGTQLRQGLFEANSITKKIQ